MRIDRSEWWNNGILVWNIAGNLRIFDKTFFIMNFNAEQQ